MREKTLDAIIKLEQLVSSVKAEQVRFDKEREKVAASTIYTPEHKAELQTRVQYDYEIACNQYTAQMLDCVRVIDETEQELENAVVDYNDKELAGLFSFVSTMGENMPADQRYKIAASVRGNYAAQRCLQDLYAKYGFGHEIELTNRFGIVEALRTAVQAFVSEGKRNASHYWTVEQQINNLCDKLNISKRVDFGVRGAALLDGVYAAAGIPVTPASEYANFSGIFTEAVEGSKTVDLGGGPAKTSYAGPSPSMAAVNAVISGF